MKGSKALRIYLWVETLPYIGKSVMILVNAYNISPKDPERMNRKTSGSRELFCFRSSLSVTLRLLTYSFTLSQSG